MISRRNFLKTSTTAALGTLVASGVAHSGRGAASGADGRILKVGLIGCGGRGTGAASQALKADPNVRLTAVGDAFADRAASSLATLRKTLAGKITVTPETTFSGLDAYQKVIDSGVDVVLLATPPAFRPEHLRAAVSAGKHIFCEKPVAVDGPGIRSVLATAAEAKRKNLSIVSGFCWRYHDGIRECMKRVHDGAIGDVRAVHGLYYTSTLTTKFPGTRQPGWTDLQWQLRNWYYFHWISGDHLVEQAVHTVDKLAWLMRDEPPVSAVATGGRQVPSSYGNIYDHFEIAYQYAGGQRGFIGCRQQDNCHREVTDYVLGTKGVFSNGKTPVPEIVGETRWRYTGNARNMYQVEHDELFASIRRGQPINDGVAMAHSSLLAIMGRMAAYTGQIITWDQALNSQESLVPEKLSWGMALTVPPMAVPGKTKFV